MGIAKIAGKIIDDLAKLMGKDIISLGDAEVADVLAGKTFYAGSTTLLTGELVLANTESFFSRFETTLVVGTSWIDLVGYSGNVPSTAKRIISCVGCLGEPSAPSGDFRCLYNDVEKVVEESRVSFPFGARWEGEGLGSAAIVHWEGKFDSGSYEMWAIGGCWYQTLA